ncbi:MAG TPA: TonB family protein [Vicinamibacterales bacterium]|nr:TonB family protein [Vicinamibacterales bacterium]
MLSALLVASILMLGPQSQPPRDRALPRTPVADSSAREAELEKRIAASPTGAAAYIELAKLQETRGSFSDAEQTLMRARQALPTNKDVVMALAAFYNRQGDFTKTMEMLDAVERLDPTDPAAPQIIATYYWEKAYKDQRLLPAEKYKYTLSGIEATDRALALKSDYADALTYKNLLLRMRATQETDPVLKQQLIAEADALRNRAIELNKQRIGINSANTGIAYPAPPPPPPPPGAPVRVGGNVQVPAKLKDVRPVYPPDALDARIQGVVIIEATIDTDGRVADAKVLRSIPQLDDAALTAVRQWEFTSTSLNGVPVPVIMTVTVNFALQ